MTKRKLKKKHYHYRSLVREVLENQEDIIKHLEDLIKCPNCCNGREVGEGAGYSECSDCGDDGHRLFGMEGTRINDLLDYEELKSGQIDI